MTSKRILVRVINHALKIDDHRMAMASESEILGTAASLRYELTQATGCPLQVSASALIDNAVTIGDARHATHFADGWLIQLRIDCKQLPKNTGAANDNQPEAQAANS